MTAANGMKGYAAITHLTTGDQSAFASDWGDGYPSVLVSFAYDKDREFFSRKLGYWPESIIGDSGAFTVWTKGETIDLDAYTAWALAYQTERPDFIPITLDVIPGSLGGDAPSERQRKKAMKAGIENSDALRAAGLRIMEVFHWHEPLSQLDLLLDRRQPGELVAVGGLAGGGSKTEKLAFVRGVFARLRDREGWDNLPRLHGLGISPLSELSYTCPWWSVDSSSWSTPGRYGFSVTSGGRRNEADRRISNPTLREVYVRRVLLSWAKQEEALTRLWAGRGIRYAE